MLRIDSIDKIVMYLACVSSQTFTYKGREYAPKSLLISPLIFRGYVCPANCGGCCRKFSLDYMPSDKLPRAERSFTTSRRVTIGKTTCEILTDQQRDNESRWCRHLRQSDGRCSIHPLQPFTCDFEPLRFLVSSRSHKPNVLTQKVYGRGWSYERTDGGRGALCRMTHGSPEMVKDIVRRLERLQDWSQYFHLPTRLPHVIKWVSSGPHLHSTLFAT